MSATTRGRTDTAAAAAREQADQTAVAARVERAGGRCECTGACGSDHAKGEGRCVNEHRQGRPLLLAPPAPGVAWMSAARTPVAQLRVWCPGCLTGAERASRRARTQAHASAQTELFGGDCA